MKTTRIQLVAVLLTLLSGSLAAAQQGGGDKKLAQKVEGILRANCYRCHGQDGVVEGGFNYVLDRERMALTQKIVPGDPDASLIFQRMATKDETVMPPDGEEPRPSEQDIALVEQWIKVGAPDFNKAVSRDFISPVDIIKFIEADLNELKDRNRPFTRYFTITHLYNADISEDELQTYRNALSKLVNSLSWGRRVIVPQPIDPAKTVLRIDLRDYRWNEQVWDQILAANPYGIDFQTEESRGIAAATQSKLPFVRADWFVANASKPPLYHEVLQLPSTDLELESLLQVDVAENMRTERVARAGFNGSGVSRNNRMVERHESPNGAYWKSYDFGGNAEKQNLFAHPLGPEGQDTTDEPFVHDGGELIFSLPNGLQGYFLVDGKGGRIDKGPTAIVSDPKRPDRAVVNGLSCMSCHYAGMIPKNDQVRAFVLKRLNAFDKADADRILALYPPKNEFDKLLKEDAERFQAAVKKTGAGLGITEPVATLALKFESELDIKLAAAESGVPVQAFTRAVEASEGLSRTLGILTVDGGTVQREAFVNQFASIVSELELGEFLPPGGEVESSVVTSTDIKPEIEPPVTTPTSPEDEADREAQFNYVKAALEEAGLPFEVTTSGNFKLTLTMDDGSGRTQVVIVQTSTRDYKNLRIRDIWSPAMKNTGPVSAEVGVKLMMDAEAQPLGAWEIIPGEEGAADTVVFTAKVAANAPSALLAQAVRQVLAAADTMEKDLTAGGDEF